MQQTRVVADRLVTDHDRNRDQNKSYEFKLDEVYETLAAKLNEVYETLGNKKQWRVR